MRKKTATSFKMPHTYVIIFGMVLLTALLANIVPAGEFTRVLDEASGKMVVVADSFHYCLLYTSPSPRDRQKSRMPSSA